MFTLTTYWVLQTLLWFAGITFSLSLFVVFTCICLLLIFGTGGSDDSTKGKLTEWIFEASTKPIIWLYTLVVFNKDSDNIAGTSLILSVLFGLYSIAAALHAQNNDMSFVQALLYQNHFIASWGAEWLTVPVMILVGILIVRKSIDRVIAFGEKIGNVYKKLDGEK